MALANGVDLVIELPGAFAVQSADYFAKGAIQLLQALGVQSLCFGTDSQNGAALDYEKFARFTVEKQAEIATLFQTYRNTGLNYPQQMTAVYRELYPMGQFDFSSPNHILGLSYAKENIRY